MCLLLFSVQIKASEISTGNARIDPNLIHHLMYKYESKEEGIFNGIVGTAGTYLPENWLSDKSFHRKQLLELFEAQRRTGRLKMSDFIAQLPRSFRLARGEVYNSNSLHCATKRAPRILMFSKDGLFCSFNSGQLEDYQEFTAEGVKDCKASLNQMECLVFDKTEGTGMASPLTLEVQPEEQSKEMSEVLSSQFRVVDHGNLCSSCHFDSQRLIMASYFLWPGFYGSIDDAHAPKFTGGALYEESEPVKAYSLSKEEAGYEEFRTYRSRNARYLAIPDHLSENLLFGNADQKGIRPLVALSFLVGAINQVRIAHIIKSRFGALPQTMQNKFSEYFRCSPPHPNLLEDVQKAYGPEVKVLFEKEEELRQRQHKYFAEKIVAQWEYGGISEDSRLNFVYDNELGTALDLQSTQKILEKRDFLEMRPMSYDGIVLILLMEKLNIPLHEISTEFSTDIEVAQTQGGSLDPSLLYPLLRGSFGGENKSIENCRGLRKEILDYLLEKGL